MKLRRGFTLIEMMITVAIVAILTAIAVPSYRNHVMKANRSAAQQFMMDIGNREEQFILDQRSYTATIGSGGLGVTPPAETAGKYTIALAIIGNNCTGSALVGPGYVITATATGSQLPDGNLGDLCFDKVGNKTPVPKWK